MLKTWVRALSVMLAFVLLLGVLAPGLSMRHAAAEGEAAANIFSEEGSQSYTYAENDSQTVSQAVYENVYTPESVVLSFNGDPSTSMGFAWYASENVTATKLEVIEAAQLENGAFPASGAKSYEGTSVTTAVYENKAAKDIGVKTTYTSHKVVADNLIPGTTYAYRAGDGMTDHWSEVAEFTTKKSGKEDFDFLFTTDSQGTTQEDFEIWNNVLEAGVNRFPKSEFIVISGDQVDHGDREEQWKWFFGEARNILTQLPLMPVVGNHESKNYDNFATHFNLPNLSNTGAKPDGSVYAFDYGPIHFMVLNTEYSGSSSNAEIKSIYENQVQWLKNEASNTDQKWKVVVQHKAPYSVASHVDDTDVQYFRQNLTKVFDELDIDLVLSGHDHTYTRSYQMKDNVPLTDIKPGTDGFVNNPEGTLYLITNAAGKKMYQPKPNRTFDYAAKYGQPNLPMFTGFRVTGDTLSFETYTVNDDGTSKIYDSYGIRKSEQPIETPKVSKVTATFNGDSQTSKGFAWYTPASVKGTDVQVIEKGAADFAQALQFTGSSYTSTNSAEETVHKAVASGLTPGKTYQYRVGDASLNVWSETGTFRTDDGNNAFTFIDLADTQAKEEEEAMLSAETLQKALQTVPDAEFVVHNGDIVDTGTKEEQWNWLLGHSQESLLQTTIAPSAGNHEDENYAFIDHFNLNTPEGSATETGAYYSYDYGNAHFMVLNSNEDSAEYANFSADQVEWMKKDAQAAKAAGAEWIIVNIHKGPYTTSNHATDKDIIGENGVRSKIAPLMAELEIDFVLQGHDHIYARTKPIQSSGKAGEASVIKETVGGQSVEYTVNPDGSIYLIPATAGAKVYYKNQKPALGDAYYNLFERAEENHAAKYGPDPSNNTRPVRGQVQNFVAITIDGGRLTATTYEIDQNIDNAEPFVIDRFGILKQTESPGGGTPSIPSEPSNPSPTFPVPSPATPVTPTPAVPAPTTPAPTTPVPTTPTPPADNASVPQPTFGDVAGHWAESAVLRAVSAGFVTGYANGDFRPNAKVTRAEFVTMIVRALDLPVQASAPSFTDNNRVGTWAVPSVAAAVEAGLISGYADGTFRPGNAMTRTELTVTIARAAKLPIDPSAKLSFGDAADIPKWAVPYIAAAQKAGLAGGVGGGRFAPNQQATRAEAVSMILAMLNK
ncbi:S-layer homology domain-containing protein [Saccharibacillus endophyticus]|uniref:SLH domain-containing protein n=1 Tax=Saccharibacillus endophyticus TaxID=2060666 RepID=A0ABQ1ZTZ5_9BACL|nr:S-layer homology domain-containing protein [Saccharibacillus endophyticus]GGH77680.1 hypothetical protein GCM10007362_21800 [Saccharibacillus endophyticus]